MLDHDKNLLSFLDRCKENNVVLSQKKMQLRKSEVPFIGHVATDKGLQASPDKIKAIRCMPEPNDVAGVRRFLGMTQYLAKFLPALSDMTAPLRALTKQNVEFSWQNEQQSAFDSIKSAVAQTPILRYYSLNEEVTVQCDASQTGLGATLMQNGQPVAYASRALTDAETRYAQIEKELLAIVFACERFDLYLYGRQQVTVQSDHQPLEAIFKKPLVDTPARLQRMLLRLQRYCLSVCYTKGKEMFLADTLSRAFINDKKSAATVSTISTLDPAVMLNCRADTRQRIKAATKDDPELQALSHQIMKGWPAHKSQVTEKLRPFWDSRDLLVSHEDLIYRGNQLVVPRSQRRKMLEIAHQGHVGMEASLRRMREVLYWPGMSKDIRTLVSTCDACLTHSDSPPRQELVQHEVTARPWSKIGVDICQLNDRQLLVVVDYFSNFIEVCRLNTITASVVIKELSALFARFGAPDTVVSDNGRQFDCADFRKFATEWNFEHVTSSPHYAQSNGKAENAVKTVKRLFKKSGETGDSEFIALLNWRNTPSEGMSTSPAERLMGRRCKTLLPCSERMLKPKFDIDKDALDLNVKKEKQASYTTTEM